MRPEEFWQQLCPGLIVHRSWPFWDITILVLMLIRKWIDFFWLFKHCTTIGG